MGLLRGRGNALRSDAKLFMAGYPRCANTFTRTAFLMANPGVPLLTHQCIPSFVIRMAQSGVPGLLLIRNPLDSAVSWAIHQNLSIQSDQVRSRFSSAVWGRHRDITIEEALAYWNDYHEALLPIRNALLIAKFEDVTNDFGDVMRAFNARWDTSYTPFRHTVENAARCFEFTEEEHREKDGSVLEMQVCRPSAKRRLIKEALMENLGNSTVLSRELKRANELYTEFVNPRKVPRSSTAAVPALSSEDSSVFHAEVVNA
ncbi:MAG TPA: hypothetical protein VHY22_07305 [Chthoniobacteraceae bacterium]|nr:hypothetical protein [Chthoniobacteraceae bacterium]